MAEDKQNDFKQASNGGTNKKAHQGPHTVLGVLSAPKKIQSITIGTTATYDVLMVPLTLKKLWAGRGETRAQFGFR